jgi:pimeloyl-ACP methyl ester carboxylesterase
VNRSLSAWDGLKLRVAEWGDPDGAPLLCLPGLVRTAEDFAGLAAALPRRRTVSLDYAGRGASGRAASVARYAPEACLRDVLDVCAALHVHGADVVGTSFGGLLAMGIRAARPGLVRRAVLNDIGPEIPAAGEAFLRRMLGYDPGFPDLAAAVAFLRERLPDLSLRGEEEWRRFGALTYEPGPDGRWHPRWDLRVVSLLDRRPPPLWPLFGALEGVPVLLVHGGASNILSAETVERMRERRPDMRVVTLPGVGHAPTLAEPAAAAALAEFLA